ncbi:MAG: hypothetical protein Kow00128_21850 [Deltaproteobacteria bacterium]
MEANDGRPQPEPYKRVYVVRIYRRRNEPPDSLVGTVEEVATGKRSSFRNGQELLDRLELSGNP